MGEEEPKTQNAGEHDRYGEPRAIEKLVERATVSSDHTLDEIAGVPFHPGALVAGFALAQNARAHQRRERQRYKPRGQNGHNDRDGELAEDAAEKSGDENQRNKNGCERKGHRQDGKRDFARAIKCSFQDRLAVFGAPHHVFQKHNRIIDQGNRWLASAPSG